MTKGTILIVDDEENIIKSITRTLMEDGYAIFNAKSGEEGLQKLHIREVDLVISDQKMPGMSGINFLKKVQIDYPDILTIMLTAYGDIETAIDAINEAGIYKFILKPWNETDLRLTVKRALELRQLVMEKYSLLYQVKKRDAILRDLEKKYPGITKVERDEDA
ncbi:MAG: response regulator [Thermodesulfobacteriota bacterium]|nr:response regulator [Thermodesulfobacteriota bacterium]